MMYALYLTPNNQIDKVIIDYEDLEGYEGYCPIHKRNLSIFVKLWEEVEKGEDMRLNSVATNLYKSNIFGAVYILIDTEDDNDENMKRETDEFYDELQEIISKKD